MGENFDRSTQITLSTLNTKPINPNLLFYIMEHLDLKNFKTEACFIKVPHNHKNCPDYHNSNDRKRNMELSEKICPYIEKKQACRLGDTCLMSHNRVEQLYSPLRYKTKFCVYYPNKIENCDYGNYCSFAHSETDITIDLLHNYEYNLDFFIFLYKTVRNF